MLEGEKNQQGICLLNRKSVLFRIALGGVYLHGKARIAQHLNAVDKPLDTKRKDGGSENGSAVLKKNDADCEPAASSLVLGASLRAVQQ
jgi:hypothetical protein